MSTGAWGSTRTIFPRASRSPAGVEPLIEEARERQRRRRRWVAALAVVAIGVGFSVSRWVGSGQAGLSCAPATACAQTLAYATNVPNPCTLLTSTEAVQILSDKLSYRQSSNSHGVHSCTWAFAPLGNFTSAHPTLTVIINSATKAQVERFQKKHGYELVPGIGQFAYATGLNGAVQMLTVWDRGYTLTVFASAVNSTLKTEKALAVQILKHL